MKNVFEQIYQTIYAEENQDKNSFFIGGNFFTYGDLRSQVNRIRFVLQNSNDNSNFIGVVGGDDLETYATLFAIWLEGRAYVPLSKSNPKDRLTEIVEQAGIQLVFAPSDADLIEGLNYIDVRKLQVNEELPLLDYIPFPGNLNAYMLFTSGSTGVPKGVPIMRSNVDAFMDSMNVIDFNISSSDKCLQMFDLTFDVSVGSIITSIVAGACLYTVPNDVVKPVYIYELMEDHDLTVLIMVPSVINFLRRFFDEIHCESVRYCGFIGEGLKLSVTNEWMACIPKSRIFNFYGPTENTIFCTYYELDRKGDNSALRDVISIGKTFKKSGVVIINKNEEFVGANEEGELCLYGEQLTQGYHNNSEKNRTSFFTKVFNGEPTRFYRTGDSCQFDEKGDLLFHGRVDFQIKIQGYRIEVSEIEFHANQFLKPINMVVLPVSDGQSEAILGAVIEAGENQVDLVELKHYLLKKIPEYMVPANYVFVPTIRLTSSGKIDRKSLTKLFFEQ